MNDIELAKKNLDGHSICLCREGEIIFDDGRGISPMMRFLSSGRDLKGFACADIIVGKAAAMLFVKAGIVSVYGRTMSEAGKAYLEEYGIPCTCETITDRIINRSGTDVCPMEKTVAGISDCDEAYEALKAKLEQLRS
ncbi:MAG: DUF1893 domain-containing protein [Lachnospiraceae bacterium]|nr:DUF1893 domain-containing protein [Lachnospiraceae bacterium]